MNNEEGLDRYAFISIKGENTKALVLGGGKAAVIKINTLLKRGFTVDCITREITENLMKIRDYKFSLLDYEFKEELVDKYHLIVICTNDEEFNKEIRNICNNKNRIYIDSTKPEESQGTICASGETKSTSFGIRVKHKNPKAAVFLCEKTEKYLESFDGFVNFITRIRNSIKPLKEKGEILQFLCSEDFMFFYEKGYGEEILDLFYGGFGFEIKDSN